MTQYTVSERPIGVREARSRPQTTAVRRKQRGGLSKKEKEYGGWLTSERPFIAWDSEGYSLADGSHHMMLWGCSSGQYICGDSLGTRECFDLMMRVEQSNPDVFHVIFAGNYDVNMMLRDLPRVLLYRLKATNKCEWEGYSIEYLRSKWLRITRGKVTVTLYDVFTFFATSFVKALQDYIGEDNEDVLRIVTGKAQRDKFTIADLPTVKRYWATELQYLVRLCVTLRDYLHTADIRISKWHGPGAVASAALRQRGFKRVSTPEDVNRAAQFGYAGGRFEAFKIGLYDGPVWQYDIRSAYPAAIATLPSLDREWRYLPMGSSEPIQRFALYRMSMEKQINNEYPHVAPFPWRRPNGMVYYPPRHGGTYVWGVELAAALQTPWADLIDIGEAWVYDDDGSRPFSWIADMYRERAQWKADGNPAQLALKLAMNSIYGKLAQQVGSSYDPQRGWKLPTFHQLEYAGYITASTRAHLFAAMSQTTGSVIACETDAVFSTSPLNLDIGKGLGQWEQSNYSGIAYLQSGLYFARGNDGEWKPRTRGFSRNKIDPSEMFQYLSTIRGYESGGRPFVVHERRFRTIGTSIGKADWRRWVDEPREIRVGMPGGKREHYPPACNLCRTRAVPYSAGLHDTVPALWASIGSSSAIDYESESTPYPLKWKGDPPSEYVDRTDDCEEWER